MANGKAWAQMANAGFQTGVGLATQNPVTMVTGAITFAGCLFDMFKEASGSPLPDERPSRSLTQLIESATAPVVVPALQPSLEPEVAPARYRSARDTGALDEAYKERLRARARQSEMDPRTVDEAYRERLRARARESEMAPRDTRALDEAYKERLRARAREAERDPRGAVAREAQAIAESDRDGTNFDNRVRALIEVAIARRAEEISRSAEAGGELDNWLRAEQELWNAIRAEERLRQLKNP
jgi:hypothetical protein